MGAPGAEPIKRPALSGSGGGGDVRPSPSGLTPREAWPQVPECSHTVPPVTVNDGDVGSGFLFTSKWDTLFQRTFVCLVNWFQSKIKLHTYKLLFSHSVMSDSATPWTAAHQASLSITISQSLLRLMSTESVMPSSYLNLCRPLLLLPSIFPCIEVFSNESALRISSVQSLSRVRLFTTP